MGGGSFEEAHDRSLSERLTEEPPPWLSPGLTAWAASVVPCERDWWRFMPLGPIRWAGAMRRGCLAR